MHPSISGSQASNPLVLQENEEAPRALSWNSAARGSVESAQTKTQIPLAGRVDDQKSIQSRTTTPDVSEYQDHRNRIFSPIEPAVGEYAGAKTSGQVPKETLVCKINDCP